jgi:hypothetical protein
MWPGAAALGRPSAAAQDFDDWRRIPELDSNTFCVLSRESFDLNVNLVSSAAVAPATEVSSGGERGMGTRKICGPILAVGFSSAVLHDWCSAAAWEGAFRVGFAACAQLTLLDLQSPLPVFTKSASSSCWWCACTSLPPCQILATWTCSILEECRLHAPCDTLLASSNDGYGDTEKAPPVECAPTPSPSWCALNSEERAPQAGGCQPPARQSHGVGPGRSDGCGVHNSARWTGLRPCPQDSIGRPQRSAGERAPSWTRIDERAPMLILLRIARLLPRPATKSLAASR